MKTLPNQEAEISIATLTTTSIQLVVEIMWQEGKAIVQKLQQINKEHHIEKPQW